MRKDQFEIWITVATDNPDLEDIAKAQRQLENLGIKYEGKIGIGFTRIQWGNFLLNLSRFENKFVVPTPAFVLGFPVRLIDD